MKVYGRCGGVALVALAFQLGACGGDPGERFFALEREYIQVVKPVIGDPPAATRALCAWLRDNQQRVLETNRDYEAFREEVRRRDDTFASVRLSALQAENAHLFDDAYARLLQDESFFEASAWFQTTRPEPLPKVCDKR